MLYRADDWGEHGMEGKFVNLTPENLATEQLCCIVRLKKAHPGVEAKRAWLAERLREGHVFRKLAGNECAFIEYAPVETAWVPVEGDNFLYIYCLWVQGAPKGHGYGRQLMEYCLADARVQGKSGVCMLGAERQKNWLSNQRFAEKFGFVPVDETADGYRLLALSFDGSKPRFAPHAKAQRIAQQELTVYYDDQCPFIYQRIEKMRDYCAQAGIPVQLVHVSSLAQAKALPCVFNNWAVFYQGQFVTVNQLDGPAIQKLMEKPAN